MKWKDSGDMVEKEEDVREEYFDEEQYSPWADRKDNKKSAKLGKVPVLFLLLAVAIVALVAALLMLIFNGGGDTALNRQMAAVEERLLKLEEKLDNYEAIDEKVTRIWEQAKSFEKFKDRFDRSEASISLRMDHLTMGLEAVQKQLNTARRPKEVSSVSTSAGGTGEAPAVAQIKYHQVQAGDTLYSISKKYGLKVDQLLEMNRMKPGSVIVPGQKLIVRAARDQ